MSATLKYQLRLVTAFAGGDGDPESTSSKATNEMMRPRMHVLPIVDSCAATGCDSAGSA